MGRFRDDIYFAFTASIITNLAIAIHGKKGTKLSAPIDFMLDWSGEGKATYKRPQTADEMLEIFKGIAATQNKKIENTKKREAIKAEKQSKTEKK